jgi:hypothetical protein
MNEKFVDFALEEYKNVTKEISAIMAEIFELEKYSILVLGAIYVFLFKDFCDKDLPFNKYVILVLPIITTLIFGLLIFSRYKRAKLLADYIKTTYEPSFGSIGDEKMGYETFLTDKLEKKNSAIFISRVLSWAVQMLIAVVIAIIISCDNCQNDCIFYCKWFK